MDISLLLIIAAFPIINVNSTTPCFLNETAGLDMWKNCGGDQDFLSMALLPFEWITGGYFSLMIVSILIMITYAKYQKAVYPVLMGSVYLPLSYFLFPNQFLSFAVIMSGLLFGILYWHTQIKQTKEY